jgi:signal transduction histidine kinase
MIEVADAGKGMPAAVLRGEQNGVGITSMRERVKEFGGRIEISSSESGTVVRGWLPVSSAVEGSSAAASA